MLMKWSFNVFKGLNRQVMIEFSIESFTMTVYLKSTFLMILTVVIQKQMIDIMASKYCSYNFFILVWKNQANYL